jgi:hypothetical protein
MLQNYKNYILKIMMLNLRPLILMSRFYLPTQLNILYLINYKINFVIYNFVIN